MNDMHAVVLEGNHVVGVVSKITPGSTKRALSAGPVGQGLPGVWGS